MTTVNAASPTDSLALKNTKSTTLDQTTFLKLMTTQLKTQDPFNPVDNTQMVAQMAQFSTTTGIAEMNASLKNISSALAGSRVGDAASWIGKAALVNGNTAGELADGSYQGEITLPEASLSTTLTLLGADGTVVHAENLGAQPAGSVPFSWDGKDAAGKPVPGPLKVLVSAAGESGSITPTVSTWTGIVGVQSPADGAATKLVTPIGNFDPTAVARLG